MLESDIQGLRSAGLIAPTIFLCVAAFLLNVVLTRLTSLQREQIAALKAFGYTNLQIGWHYMKFVLLITMAGGLIGTVGGMWLAHDFTKLFLRVYQYPELVFQVRPNVVANAVLVAGGAAIAGAFGAIAAGGSPAAGRSHAARAAGPLPANAFWNESAWAGSCPTWPAWCCGSSNATPSRRRSRCWRFRCRWRSSWWEISCATRSTR